MNEDKLKLEDIPTLEPPPSEKPRGRGFSAETRLKLDKLSLFYKTLERRLQFLYQIKPFDFEIFINSEKSESIGFGLIEESKRPRLWYQDDILLRPIFEHTIEKRVEMLPHYIEIQNLQLFNLERQLDPHNNLALLDVLDRNTNYNR